MATTLQKEIEELKHENMLIKKRLDMLEKNEARKKTILGIFLIATGCLLSLTLVGALVGVPLIIWGIMTLSSQPSQQRPKKRAEPSGETSNTSTRPPEAVKSKSAGSIEEDVGMKWFARIGILALVIGIGFFVKYSIDNNWISHLTRIILGALLGAAMVVIGDRISRIEKYSIWGKTLAGGGFALTYFVVFSAYHFADYRQATGISQLADIMLLAAVVFFAVVFSIKDNSQVIAAESFFLGYITSLLSDGTGILMLAYGLILAVGLVYVVSVKKWHAIGFGGLLASYLLYAIWENNSFSYAAFILASYYAAFTLQSFFLMRSSRYQDLGMVVLNSTAFYVLSYIQLERYHPDYTGLFTLGVALVSYIGFLLARGIKQSTSNAYMYLTVLFSTLAVAVQLDKSLVTSIWAFEALALAMLAKKTSSKTFMYSSWGVSLFTILKVIFYDSWVLEAFDITAIAASTRLISFLVTVICFYAISEIMKEDRTISTIYSWAAVGLAVIISFLEFDIEVVSAILALLVILLELSRRRFQAYAAAAILFISSLTSSPSLARDEAVLSSVSGILAFWYLALRERKMYLTYPASVLAFFLVGSQLRDIWVSVGWCLLALALTVVGFVWKERHLRLQGMVILALTITKVFLYDTRSLDTLYRTISYMVLGLILLLVSFIYTKYKEKLKEIL